MRYSRLLTEEQIKQQLKARLDNFATFKWRGKDCFDEYNMFIISQEGDLKFYNGPTFSNEYTKPQYQSSAGNLTGISFNNQQISFTVGIYYFSIERYREILEWLNPYEINYLGFSFSPVYNYLVKLSKIGDSKRIIVGRESGGFAAEDEYRYYTELTLTFDLQGPACVRGVTPYEFNNPIVTTTTGNNYLLVSPKPTTKNISGEPTNPDEMNNYYTDLDSPLVFDIQLVLNADDGNGAATIQLEAIESVDNDTSHDIETELFSIQFQNLTTFSAATVDPVTQLTYLDNVYILNLVYDSETGLLFEKYGNNTRKLLSLLSSSSAGKSLVKMMHSICFALPGKVGKNWTNTRTRLEDRWKFKLNVDSNIKLGEYATEIVDPQTGTSSFTTHQTGMQITCYARTNVI